MRTALTVPSGMLASFPIRRAGLIRAAVILQTGDFFAPNVGQLRLILIKYHSPHFRAWNVCTQPGSFWGPRNPVRIAVSAITAAGADDADGADAIFNPCAYLNHSGPGSAFPRERDFDTQAPEERLRP